MISMLSTKPMWASLRIVYRPLCFIQTEANIHVYHGLSLDIQHYCVFYYLYTYGESFLSKIGKNLCFSYHTISSEMLEYHRNSNFFCVEDFWWRWWHFHNAIYDLNSQKCSVEILCAINDWVWLGIWNNAAWNILFIIIINKQCTYTFMLLSPTDVWRGS